MRKDEKFDLVMKRLDALENKLDQVRTKDLPKVTQDVALLVKETGMASKVYAGIAVALSAVVSYWRH